MGMEFVLLRIRADIIDFVNCHSSTEEGKKEGRLFDRLPFFVLLLHESCVIRHCSAGTGSLNRRREEGSLLSRLPFFVLLLTE